MRKRSAFTENDEKMVIHKQKPTVFNLTRLNIRMIVSVEYSELKFSISSRRGTGKSVKLLLASI